MPPRFRLVPALLLSAALALALLAPLARAAGIDPAGMKPAVAPGDDFFAYANGTWFDATEIPADRSAWGSSGSMDERTSQRLAELIDGIRARRATASPAERLTLDFHTAYMDEAAIEARGLAPLQPQLDRLAAINDRTDLARALGETLRADVDPINATNFFTENLFGLWVAQAFDDPDHYTPYLLQGGLGMSDRAYYLTDSPRMAKLRDQYRQHIATVLQLAGFPDAAPRAARIYDLELKIAATHATREESVDVIKANNPWSRADFAAKAPGLDWDTFFAAAGLTQPPRFILWHPGAVTGCAALVASEPLAVWKDYLAYHAINKLSGILPKAFADERFAFYSTAMVGTPQQSPRWKRAIASTSAAVGDAVGQVYVAKYFPPASKARVQEMVTNIVRAFGARVDRLDWMAPATKAQAKAKLKVLHVGVGYPDQWADYTGLVIDPADAAGNSLRASEFRYRRRVALLGGPVDRTEWSMTPQTVNAVNMPMQNALNFPAGYLQPPFFDPAADDATNYGAIGTTIGHEISHSFDDQGALFDAQGRLRDWWTPEDLAHFKASSAQLVAQYNAYRPFPDLGVNGQLTLSENLADLAGVAAAFDGLKASLAEKPQPAGGQFTPEQIFFISFGQKWRNKMREGALRQRLLTDGHAPSQYRALTVRNLDAWYEAFGIKPGAALYLEPAARVRVW